ncbi:MAG: SMP-30/gluconolactonase/LRE family protein [Pseudomonadota bacterium]
MQKVFLPFALALLASCGLQGEPAQSPENADERATLAAGSELWQPATEQDLLGCETIDGMTPHCGFQNPEDLVNVPGTDLLIVSEMGEFMADTPGDLSLLDLATGQRASLAIDWQSEQSSWGASDCPAPDVPAFSPHGIDLTTRDDGAVALLVVNHGGRESIEFFEVASTGNLAWRGCALPPEDPFINDVAARSDGGFYVTHMWNKSASFEATAEALLAGKSTGWVWAWTRDTGFSRLPNTDDLMPNGIALNADNTVLYVNVYMGNRMFALDLASNTRTREMTVRQPDNITVDDTGTLWIASHQHDPIRQACTQVTAGPCLLPFQIVKADPDSLEPTVVIDQEGSPTGYSTVALKFGNRLYLGTAHGDRVISVAIQ